jgi:magnesium chelatase family protein
VSRYNRRISGPLLDRIDVFVDVPRVEYEKLAAAARAEPSASVSERVSRAREVQHRRFAGEAAPRLTAEMSPPQVRDFVQAGLDADANELLRLAANQLSLSARSFHRLLKVSRTIADLDGSEKVGASHIAESIQYRSRAAAT